jgi:hypothetical protein
VAHEVSPLVRCRTEPRELALIDDGIEHHDPLDHPSRRVRLPKAAVGLADGCPQWLVVNVEHPAAMQFTGGDRRSEPPLHEPIDEVRALLAVHDAGMAAVLPLDEDTGVEQHLEQEPRLALGETERGDGRQPLGVGLLDGPLARRRRQRHRSSSSASRGCEVRRPPPPPRPPTAPPTAR